MGHASVDKVEVVPGGCYGLTMHHVLGQRGGRPKQEIIERYKKKNCQRRQLYSKLRMLKYFCQFLNVVKIIP